MSMWLLLLIIIVPLVAIGWAADDKRKAQVRADRLERERSGFPPEHFTADPFDTEGDDPHGMWGS